MRLTFIWLLFLLPFPIDFQAQISTDSRAQKSKWKAANYRGMVVGQALITEALKLLGRPDSVGLEADHDINDPNTPLLYQYRRGGDFQGNLDFVVDKRSKRILEIFVSPDHLTREKAIAHFGSGYIQKRYSFCPDIDDTTAPIYEDPSGEILQVEYPHKGIILSVSDENEIISISYVRTNMALDSVSKCKKQR
jgi:hypothetical protein